MKSKYDELCFSMVVEVFRYLPLVHLIDSKVLVVHGGLFGRAGVLLEDIEAIDRTDYTCAPPPESTPPESAEAARSLDLKQLMRDCLWSDPKDLPGPAQFNHARRQGQLFGPDVTEAFLRQNGLQMVVRSHEWYVFIP
jgi:serine/threonine-protein phosphatase 5